MALSYTESQVEGILNKVSSDGTNFNKVFIGQPSDDGEYVLDKDGFKKKFNLIFSNNLLDNSNFKKMVDQYGRISEEIQTITESTYFIDRWKTSSEKVNIQTEKNGLTISNTIIQVLPDEIHSEVKNNLENVVLVAKEIDPKGNSTKKITIYKYDNGKEEFSFIQGDKTNNNPNIKLFYSTTDKSFKIEPINSLTLEYVALYICNDASKIIDENDIPLYIPKSYAEELAICQRYYRIVQSNEKIIFKGVIETAGSSSVAPKCSFFNTTPVVLRIANNMRIPPSLIVAKYPDSFLAIQTYKTLDGINEQLSSPWVSDSTITWEKQDDNSYLASSKFSLATSSNIYVAVQKNWIENNCIALSAEL